MQDSGEVEVLEDVMEEEQDELVPNPFYPAPVVTPPDVTVEMEEEAVLAAEAEEADEEAIPAKSDSIESDDGNASEADEWSDEGDEWWAPGRYEGAEVEEWVAGLFCAAAMHDSISQGKELMFDVFRLDYFTQQHGSNMSLPLSHFPFQIQIHTPLFPPPYGISTLPHGSSLFALRVVVRHPRAILAHGHYIDDVADDSPSLPGWTQLDDGSENVACTIPSFHAILVRTPDNPSMHTYLHAAS
ncbi:unnamed protein product [Closterium sp. Naga37s-1]|nr:unnamed protein product [Closterium sp. Naga37s-1]